MENDTTLKFGHQPRPAVPPSAASALGVLVGVSVGLLLVVRLCFWTSPMDVAGPPFLRAILNSGWTWLILLAAGNSIVFAKATLPMGRNTTATPWQEYGRNCVLALALLFHLFFLLLGFVCFALQDIQVGYGST